MGGEKPAEPAERAAENATDSRRTFLRAMGAVSALAGAGGLAGAQETTTDDGESGTTEGGASETTTAGDATTIVLGGRVSEWVGLAPEPIHGEPNPTLGLRPGEQYRLVWINLDGERHEWLLEGSEAGEGDEDDGQTGVAARTEATDRVGATRSTAFEMTDAAADYRCEYHPERMRGSVEPGEGFETTAGETTATDEGAEATTAEDDAETTAGENGDGTTTGEAGGETTAGAGEVVDVAVGPEGQYLRFVPEEVEISVGDTVRWTAESEGHNVTARPEAATQVDIPDGAESFASYEGNRSFMVMEVGATFEHTFTVPGEYVYVCAPHAGQGMIGRVVVSE